MATRTKTIRYALPTYTALVADAVVTNLTQITAYIPEFSGIVTFKSVFLEVGFQDVVTATGGTITEHRVGLAIAGGSYTTFTETDDITHTGENIGGIIAPIDFTSKFVSEWTSGTSKTIDVQVFFDQSTGTTLGMRNVTAVLVITYDYDDTQTTHIKTAYIPLESLAGALGTTANGDIGTNQIPILTGASGILPEASITIRDYYFLIEGNVSNNNTTTDFTVTANIDSGTNFAFGVVEAALGTDYYTRLIYKPSIPTTTTAHNFQLWSSVANKMNFCCITLVVTYEFNASTTTTVLQSIVFPIEISSPVGVTTSAEASRFTRDIFTQEASVSLKQSAFRIHYNTTASVAGINFRAGGQSFRAYTHIGNACAGMFCFQQRIDSDSAQGAGFTLSRGKSTINIDGYTTDTIDQMTNVSGYIVLNYHGSKHAQGVGAHNSTTEYLLSEWNAAAQDRIRINNYSVAIPETYYFITSLGFIFHNWSNVASQAITLDVECLAGEGKGAGYYDVYADAYQSDAEIGYSAVYMRGRDVFNRFPEDPDPERLDIETSRDYRIFKTQPGQTGLTVFVTTHSIYYETTLNIAGSNGGSVTVDVYRTDNKERVFSTSRTGNGAVTLRGYDNTIDVYAVCYEDSTHLGRSNNFKFGD